MMRRRRTCRGGDSWNARHIVLDESPNLRTAGRSNAALANLLDLFFTRIAPVPWFTGIAVSRLITVLRPSLKRVVISEPGWVGNW